MKRTLKRELKVLEIVEGEAIGARRCAQAYAVLTGRLYVLGAGQHGLSLAG